MTENGALELVLRIPLTDEDMDQLGHLNQARYHGFLGTARAKLLSGSAERDERVAFVVARVELDYLHEVRMADGHVDVRAKITRIGEKSVTIENEIRRPDGTVAARGLAIMVAWDDVERRSRQVTDAERAALTG
jgi:acyl-CoA thioester hydrolase